MSDASQLQVTFRCRVSESKSVHHSVVSGSLRPIDCSLSGSSVHKILLFQGIFPTQGSNPGLLHFRQILYHLSHEESPSRAPQEAPKHAAEMGWRGHATPTSYRPADLRMELLHDAPQGDLSRLGWSHTENPGLWISSLESFLFQRLLANMNSHFPCNRKTPNKSRAATIGFQGNSPFFHGLSFLSLN